MMVLAMLTVAYYAHKNNWGADIKFLRSRVGKAMVRLGIVIAFPPVIWGAVVAAPTPLAAGITMVALFGRTGSSSSRRCFRCMTPVLLIGGMTTGIFTPTEGAVASIWALFLGLFWYRTLSSRCWSRCRWRPSKRRRPCFIAAAASIFGWLLTATRVTDMVTVWVLGFTSSPWVFLLLVNLLLLFVGCFLEPTAAILSRSGADAGGDAARHRPGALRVDRR
jgi:TRAP-type C4-dicarboxylate transport system permease large subunit